MFDLFRTATKKMLRQHLWWRTRSARWLAVCAMLKTQRTCWCCTSLQSMTPTWSPSTCCRSFTSVWGRAWALQLQTALRRTRLLVQVVQQQETPQPTLAQRRKSSTSSSRWESIFAFVFQQQFLIYICLQETGAGNEQGVDKRLVINEFGDKLTTKKIE